MPRVKTLKDADSSRAPMDSAENETVAAAGASPKKRAIRMGPDEFAAFINVYDNADKSEVYVYRLWPAINRKPAYIQKLPALEFSADWLLRNWGSGDYNIVLTDSSVYGSPKVGETFIKFPFDVDQWPMVDYEELLVDHPGNKDFVKQARMRGFLPASSTAAGPSDPVTLLQNQISEQRREMAELRKRASESNGPEAQAVTGAISMLQQTATQSNAMLMEQVKALTAGQGTGGIEKLLVPLLNMQAQSHQSTMSLLISLITSQQTVAPKSSITELKELLAFMREVRESEPERETPEVSTFERLAPALLSALPALFGGGQAARPAPVPAPVPGPVPAPVSAPGPAHISSDEILESENPDVMLAVLQQLGGQLVRALEREMNGLEFAQSVEVAYGAAAYDQLRGLGAERLKGLLMSHADTWRAVAPLVSGPGGSLDRLDVFLSEFVAYGDEGGEGGAL